MGDFPRTGAKKNKSGRLVGNRWQRSRRGALAGTEPQRGETSRGQEGYEYAVGLAAAVGRKGGFKMTTEQIYTKVGEWYWGAKCPECGEMAAHSKGDSEKPGGQQVTMTCPNGHFFPARTEELLHFEWGAQ